MAANVDALNYPYIRIRDVEWLKKTLLLFPHVARITPSYRAPADDDAVGPFCSRLHGGEPLLRPVNLKAEYVLWAQDQLGEQIEALDAADPAFRKRFGKASRSRGELQPSDLTVWERRLGPDATFQIHRTKMIDPLVRKLVDKGVAWAPSPEVSDGPDYIEMNPRLGEAVMATIAAACAENEALRVVTEYFTGA